MTGCSPVLLLLLAMLMALAACAGPGTEAKGGDSKPFSKWSYATGLHGETCLFYAEGIGNDRVLAMSCINVSGDQR